MTPEGIERIKRGVFPERQDLTVMDLFVILKAKEDGSAMRLLESVYKSGTILMKTSPEFRRKANEMTLKLQSFTGDLDELADAQNEVRGNWTYGK